MLIGVDPLIGPDLLYTLASMGHGDELVIVDRNFPAMSNAERVHRLDGVRSTEAIAAVLTLLPLDSFIERPLESMEIVGRPGVVNEVQAEALLLASEASGRDLEIGSVPRQEFYERTRAAYAVLVTGEDRPFGCFILTKGVLPDFTP